MDQLHDRANIDVVFAKDRAWVSSYLEGGVRPAIPELCHVEPGASAPAARLRRDV